MYEVTWYGNSLKFSPQLKFRIHHCTRRNGSLMIIKNNILALMINHIIILIGMITVA
jgi:hypothetical protein